MSINEIIESISWVVTGAAVVGTVANAFKKKWCFIVWMITNTFWIFYNIHNNAYSLALLYCVNLIIAVLGLYKWSNHSNDGMEPRNIKQLTDNILRGNCPVCGMIVINTDGNVIDESYCSGCGCKIVFPPMSQKINGIKTETLEARYSRTAASIEKHNAEVKKQ